MLLGTKLKTNLRDVHTLLAFTFGTLGVNADNCNPVWVDDVYAAQQPKLGFAVGVYGRLFVISLFVP